VPLVEGDGKSERVIEIVIDRTNEVLLERVRRNDFGRLIGTLSVLLEVHDDAIEYRNMLNKIIELRNRLNELLSRKTL
jgi:hypothetical protein